MKEFQRKQRIRRIVYSIPFLLIFSVVAFFLTKGAIKMVGKEWESSKRTEGLEARVSALAFREQELKEGVARLQTEEGIKDEIKERFSVTEDGEYVAIIVDEKRSPTSTDSSTLPWYRRFWSAIIGNK